MMMKRHYGNHNFNQKSTLIMYTHACRDALIKWKRNAEIKHNGANHIAI